jgi:hypothetical protein
MAYNTILNCAIVNLIHIDVAGPRLVDVPIAAGQRPINDILIILYQFATVRANTQCGAWNKNQDRKPFFWFFGPLPLFLIPLPPPPPPIC